MQRVRRSGCGSRVKTAAIVAIQFAPVAARQKDQGRIAARVLRVRKNTAQLKWLSTRKPTLTFSSGYWWLLGNFHFISEDYALTSQSPRGGPMATADRDRLPLGCSVAAQWLPINSFKTTSVYHGYRGCRQKTLGWIFS
jgi:hypothetical protein